MVLPSKRRCSWLSTFGVTQHNSIVTSCHSSADLDRRTLALPRRIRRWLHTAAPMATSSVAVAITTTIFVVAPRPPELLRRNSRYTKATNKQRTGGRRHPQKAMIPGCRLAHLDDISLHIQVGHRDKAASRVDWKGALRILCYLGWVAAHTSTNFSCTSFP